MLDRLYNTIFTHKGNKNSSSYVDYFLFNVFPHAEGKGILML
jgi:hypothetical protein